MDFNAECSVDWAVDNLLKALTNGAFADLENRKNFYGNYFINQCLENKPITIYGDGSQTRSFCYIDDMVRGIYKLLHSKYTKPMNLGNPEEIALIDFAKEIITMGGANNKIVYKPLPINDPVKRRPDTKLSTTS